MVTRNKTGEKKGTIKVGKLKLNKETVQDLSGSEEKQIKGGAFPISISQCWCTATLDRGDTCRGCK